MNVNWVYARPSGKSFPKRQQNTTKHLITTILLSASQRVKIKIFFSYPIELWCWENWTLKEMKLRWWWSENGILILSDTNETEEVRKVLSTVSGRSCWRRNKLTSFFLPWKCKEKSAKFIRQLHLKARQKRWNSRKIFLLVGAWVPCQCIHPIKWKCLPRVASQDAIVQHPTEVQIRCEGVWQIRRWVKHLFVLLA